MKKTLFRNARGFRNVSAKNPRLSARIHHIKFKFLITLLAWVLFGSAIAAAEEKANQIVSIGGSVTEIIYALGEEDRLIPNRFMHGGPTRDVMRVGQEGIAGSRLVELERCGHTLQMDCHTEYNAAVLGFIKAL